MNTAATAAKSATSATSSTQDKLRQDVLISAITLPTLALLFAARSAAHTMITVGRWSEELLRGDRAPIQIK